MTGIDLILVILLALASYFSLVIAYSSGFKLLFLDIFSNEFDSFSTNPKKKVILLAIILLPNWVYTDYRYIFTSINTA